MRYFIDTEFIEDGKTIDLLTIAIVAEDGRELYLGHRDCKFYNACEWVRENILKHLDGLQEDLNDLHKNHDRLFWLNKKAIAKEIIDFIGKDEPEFWGYYCASDWVVFYQIFGTLEDIPDNFPYHCYDLKQEHDRLGSPGFPEHLKGGDHNALRDAQWNREVYEYLNMVDFTKRSKALREAGG